MTRTEIYAAIKAKGLVEKANERARALRGWVKNANYTNLPNGELLRILDTVKSKESKPKTETTQKGCVDEGARKAILAMAAYFNLKGIEKNFE